MFMTKQQQFQSKPFSKQTSSSEKEYVLLPYLVALNATEFTDEAMRSYTR